MSLVLLSLVIGVVQGIYLLHWFERYSQAIEDAIVFENKRGEIARLDEVLTMSARLHATTGEFVWRARYQNHVALIDSALSDALALAGNEAAERAIDRVSDSNDVLIALEEESLQLAAKSLLSRAFLVVTSPVYEQHKASYQAGLNEALEISHLLLREKVDANRSSLLIATVFMMLSLLILSELWRRLSVAEQREAARQITSSLEREQQLNGLQRQFVSILSHELRTPLSIIDGRAQKLERAAATLTKDKIESSATVIRKAVKQLIGLMEGVLNVSRIEEGRIDIHPETFDLTALIESVVAGHREVNGGRQIDLALAGLPATAHGDPKLLTQVISNLVSNALKYSKADRLVRVEGREDGDEIVIAIHDQGVGIPEDEIERLGHRFFRASSSAGVAGTGIGLHFIKHLIELHGGRMTIESTLGVGSTFAVHIPLRPAIEPAADVTESGKAEAVVPSAVPAH